MKRVTTLVVGGSGFLGQQVVEQLVSDGQDVRTLDLGPPKNGESRITHFSGSFLQAELLQEAMTGVDCVYHLAATMMPSVADRNIVRDCTENVIGTVNLLELALQCGVGRLVFSSSGGTVYGRASTVPITETQATHPITAYGISKLACEKYIRLYNGRGDLRPLSTVSLRISNPYGAAQNINKAQGALTTFCWKAVKKEPIEIWGDGSIERDFVDVRDVSDALVKAGGADGPETSGCEINIGSGVGTSLNTLLKIIARMLGHDLDVNYKAGRSFDVQRNYLDVSRAEKLLDWKPSISLERGISELLESIQSRVD